MPHITPYDTPSHVGLRRTPYVAAGTRGRPAPRGPGVLVGRIRHYAAWTTSFSSAKWHADSCAAGVSEALKRSGIASSGTSVAHLSCAFQQRVRKRQPDGGLAGDGTSPARRIRSRGSSSSLTSGTAESS